MHLLIIAQYFWPENVGAGVWLHQLATGLANRGHRVSMLTALPNYPEGRVFPAYRGRFCMREQVEGVEVVRTYIYATPRKSFWPRAASFASFCASALFGGVLLERPDVIFCVLPPLPLGWTAGLIGLAKRTPVVVNVQDIYPDIAVSLGYLKNPLAIRFFQTMEKSICQHSAALVVITESFRQNLLRKGVPGEKIAVIPNWADADSIRPGPKANEFRSKVGAEGKFLVVYSGGMGHNTCLETVLEAAHLLHANSYRFVLIGDGPRRPELEERAARLRLRNLRFLPFQPAEAYPQVLAASDIQLVTLNESATHLSMPSKVLKILASGRPILAVTRPESDLARLVQQAQCGITVRPDDAAGLARALERLAQAPAQLEGMGENARQMLEQRFDRERCVGQLESLLLQVAGDRAVDRRKGLAEWGAESFKTRSGF